MIYMIMEKTNMSWHEVLWKRSWINVLMMFADAPKSVYKKKTGAITVSGKEMAAKYKSKKING